MREAGGLLVISAAAQPTERALAQLRGRAGRRGDPGQTYSLLSMHDDYVLKTTRTQAITRWQGAPGSPGAVHPWHAPCGPAQAGERVRTAMAQPLRRSSGWCHPLAQTEVLAVPQQRTGQIGDRLARIS